MSPLQQRPHAIKAPISQRLVMHGTTLLAVLLYWDNTGFVTGSNLGSSPLSTRNFLTVDLQADIQDCAVFRLHRGGLTFPANVLDL